jgi:hypothetical protein
MGAQQRIDGIIVDPLGSNQITISLSAWQG